MIDFIPVVLTRDMFLGISIFFLAVVVLFWRRNVTNFDRYSGYQLSLSLLFLIHLLFAFDGGDFFHYYEFFIEKDFHGLERVYRIIAKMVFYDYLAFRAVVWGGALAVFQLAVRRFKLETGKATFLLYVMFIGVFDYARASLAMAIYFLGLSYICYPIKHNRMLSYFVAIFLIVLSVSFHRSMIFTAAMTIMVFFPMNPYCLLALLVVLSLSVPLLNTFFNDYILSGELITDESINRKIAGYANQTYYDRFSIYEWIRRIVSYVTFFLPVIYLSFKFFKKENLKRIHPSIIKLYKVTVGILLLAVASLVMDIESFVIFYRYLYMAMIPVTILILYGRKNGYIPHKVFLFFIYLCLSHELFGIFKRLLGGSLG